MLIELHRLEKSFGIAMTLRRSCIVITFGWSWEFVSRAIVFRGGLKPSDKLILITSRARGDYEATRFREALYAVEKFIESLGRDFDECCRVCEVDTHDKNFLNLISGVASCIANELPNCDSLEAYLLGGMRMLVLATLYSIDILKNLTPINTSIYTGPEDGSTIMEIPHQLHKNISYCTENQLKLLAKLYQLNEATLDQLAEEGKSLDSIRKTMEKLINKGLVTKKSRGRKVVYELTELGKIVASLYIGYKRDAQL